MQLQERVEFLSRRFGRRPTHFAVLLEIRRIKFNASLDQIFGPTSMLEANLSREMGQREGPSDWCKSAC